MENQIFGRDKEKKLFHTLYSSKNPAFIALYGRRRIGKTFLIEKFFQDKGLFFHLTGIKNAKTHTQIRNFTSEFSDVFFDGKQQSAPKNWAEAFSSLRKEVQKRPRQQKVILFLDELPWLASPRSGFLQALDHFWNRYLSSMENCILIVCGSAASWMINKVLNSRGGLHGRITHEIPLYPFDLKETKDYLAGNHIHLEESQVVELYFALGGVAKYLTYVKTGLSAAQNINRLCFSKNGPLLKEFHRLYHSLFNESDAHIAIVRALAKIKSGLPYQTLAKQSKISVGGTFSGYLKELETSGFIHQISTFAKGVRSNKYVLSDEFSLFYLTWMENLSSIDLDDENLHYWMNKQGSSQYEAWKGFAFERICMKHLKELKKALGITSVITKTSKWSSDGVEIDWVVDRDDSCINLFEAKFINDQFSLSKAYAETLRKKKRLFREQTQSKKTLFTTVISPYGVKKNEHYFGTIDAELLLTDLFA